MLDENIEIINPDDKDYYDNKLFEVGIWPGAGYQLATFKVYANSEEEALNLVVANAEINAPGLLMSIQEIEDLIAEDYQEEYNEFISENPESDDFTFATEYLNYIYVDATMEGASQPYFVTGDNLVIEELDDKKEESINTVSDKPHYIAKCTLEATEDIPNIYLLLDDKDSGGISGLDIVLVESRFGNLMYNTDYNVKDLEIVKTVYNLTELVNFMKTKGEDLSSMVTDKGIPVGFGDMLPEDLNHYIIGEEGDPTLEESRKVEKINDYEYVIYRQRLTKSPIYVKDYSTETENKDEAITFPTEHEAEEYRDELELSYKEQYKIGVKTESKDNDTIHISKNDDMKEIHTQPGQITGNNVNKMKKQVKTESENNSANIVWEHIEDYSQDEIDEIRNILEDLEVEAVKISDHSVAVKIKSNEMIFWLDYAQEGDDIVGDWNQYIFSTVNSIDRIREAIQTSYFKDTGDTFAFDIMESAGLEYLEKNGVVVYTDDGYRFNDNLKENKKLNEKYNQDGFPNNEELEDLFTRQGTLPDEITIDDRKYAMTEYGGTGENAWVIYSDTDNDDSYIRVYYSMNKLGKDSYQGVKKILGVSDLREAKQIKNEYYVKPDDEHIIWDSEFDINNFDMDDLKDTHYQNYLDNFDDTVTPMDYEDWLDSDNCANYFDLEWEEAAKENTRYEEWYEFITEYVSDEEKEEAYNEYVENCNNTKLQPKDFEEWLDDNTNQLAEDDWEIKEEDLDVNILPEIDRQINYDTLILTGYYGSNYPDFRSSGNGGKMFDSIEDFKNYMGNFDRVCITTKNGILGSILNDHDGTVSGQFYTLPENLTDLVKAINYEQYVDIPEDITDEAEILETVIDQFEEDLVYGSVDTSDLTNHIELLVPIKDTISGYTPDPEPKKESKEKEYRYITNHGIGPGTMPKDTYIRSEDLDNGKTAIYLNRPLTQQELDKYDIKPEWVQESKEKEDPNKYCAICGKEKEDYEASMCDDCWEKEQERLNNTKIKETEAVEYISKKDYDKLPASYKTTIGKTLKARQAVGDNIEKLRQLYKDLGYNEDDPMIMANEKGGTILKPVKVQESKMSEIDIDVKNTLKQFDDYLENEGYDEVDDDVVNEFFTEIFYNIDTEEELEAMNIAEKKIRHKYGLRENKISNKKKIVAKEQRLEMKKENKSNIETVYVPEKDMTIIFEETTDDNDNPTSTEIKGFYYGSPSDDETKKFTGKLKATYDTIQESKTLVEDDTDPEEVANEIQTARENSENDTLSIEQIASSLDVLLVDEQGAIDGYKSYLEQAKQVVSEELYNSIDTQIQEIIKDEEDHIVKLNTMKDTLLGNTDNTPATDIENIDDEENLVVEESKQVTEASSNTIKEELNTGILPVVNVDMYSLSDNLYEYDIDQKELDDIVLEIAPKYIEDTLSEILPNVSVIAKSVYHPKQYNYSGDELEFDLVIDSNAYEELKEKTLNNPEFKQFLKDNYSSRSGFVSFMADDLDDFKTQEEWKQMVQVIMFNIPKDKIELNNDQYITEFMDNVYMNYAPIDDEDDLTENKSLKTENKDEWVKNWEELNSMIEYYAEQEGFTLNDNDLYDITNALAEKGVLDTFADFKSNEDKAKNTIIAAIEQFPNKVEESTEDLDDDDDDFPYDNTTEKKCPKCGKTYTDFPALSRKDNKTYICPQCGGKEAMEDYLKSLKEDNSVDTEEFKVGDVVTDLIDNDLAVIEEIDDTRKSKYLLRFVQNPVMGEAFWYEPGRFEKVTDEETIKEALDIYNRNMKK